MAQVDADLLMLKYLQGQASFMTAVSNRVYGPPAGIPKNITEPCPFVLFVSDGTPGNVAVPMAITVYQFYIYGADAPAARSVYHALFGVLHRVGNQRVTLAPGEVAVVRFFTKTGGPNESPEPELGWPRVVANFAAIYCETTFGA